MSRIDTLPSDQRAVLALVVQRGRSYEEIAGMLAIDRGSVRQRALDALGALAPEAAADATDRNLVGDYLLGQLPARVASEVRRYIASSGGDSRWARAVAAELAPLLTSALPDIPVGAPLGADVTPAPEPVQPAPDLAERVPRGRRSAASRRRRWAIAGVVALAIAVAVVVVIDSGGGSSPRSRVVPVTHTTHTTRSTPKRPSPAGPRTLATIAMVASSPRSGATGVAEVLRRGANTAIVIDARGLPANGPHNAYAVWLSSGPGRSWLVGFVPIAVGKRGALQTEGQLPSTASQYRRLLLTLETRPAPTHPGKVVLAAPFRQ